MSPAELSATPLDARFEAHLRESRLLEGASRLVVACSGGGDSTALLALLIPVAERLGLELYPTHVAHGLRGEKGLVDARFVADLTRDLGLPFVLRPFSVAELRRAGESVEAAARRIRYESLLGFASALGEGTPIATGHTLDDQAETVLLNLSRHAGRTRGGIRERRADGVVRPLLPFSRSELRSFLEGRGIPWREDETNEDERFLRNRIRRRTLPELEARWPAVSRRLARAAGAWTRRLDALDAAVDERLAASRVAIRGPFPRAFFREWPAETAARLLVRALGDAGDVPGRSQLRRVLERLAGGEERVTETVAGQRLSADSRTVFLTSPDRLPR